MTHEREDLAAEIAKATATRDRLQAELEVVGRSYDSCRLIDIKFSLAEANRRVVELRSKQAAAQPLESVRSSAIFYGTNR